MTDFFLPAGAKIKYGTVSTHLYPILRHGIQADAAPRIASEDSNDHGGEAIYVGDLMAYFSACVAFCNATGELHTNNEEILGQFVSALQESHGEKPNIAELEGIAAQAGLPVVLELELAEDCRLMMDAQFAPELVDAQGQALSDADEKCWKHWRCGAILREGGIPASWVKKFYFPRLLDYRDVGNSRNPRMLEQTTDSALMVGGLMQSWHKDAPADLLQAFSKQYRRINFSQQSAFDETALERFFNLNAMLDPATRLLNQMTIWQDISALAKKQEIPLG